MKITRGFVAVQPDGQFLYLSSHQMSSGGAHIHIAAVADIEDATVRNNPGPRDRKEAAVLSSRQITWVPVEIRREVIRQDGIQKEVSNG